MSEVKGVGTGGSGVSDAEIARRTPPVAGGREIRVGIFVLLGLVALLATLFVLTDPATFRGRYIVFTEVENAGGIRRGDPVQMRGVNVGRVHQFELIPDGVRIALEVEGEWRFPSDSRTRLAGLDLLGGRTVEVVPGTAADLLPVGATMPGEAVSGVMEMADDIGAEARATMESVRSLLSTEAIENLQGAFADLRDLAEALTEVVAEQRSELADLSASLNRSADRVEDLTGMPELESAISRADSTFARLTVVSENLERATASVDSILARVERGEGSLGLLVNDESLYRNMNTAVEELTTLAREVRENPGDFIRLRIF